MLAHLVAQVLVVFLALIHSGGPGEPTPILDVLAAIVAFPFVLAHYHSGGHGLVCFLLLGFADSLLLGCIAGLIAGAVRPKTTET